MTHEEDTVLCRNDPRAKEFRHGGDCAEPLSPPCLKRALWTFGGVHRCTQHTADALRR